LRDSGATYDDHLRLIGKRRVYFLLAFIKKKLLGVTAEATSDYLFKIGYIAPVGPG